MVLGLRPFHDEGAHFVMELVLAVFEPVVERRIGLGRGYYTVGEISLEVHVGCRGLAELFVVLFTLSEMCFMICIYFRGLLIMCNPKKMYNSPQPV